MFETTCPFDGLSEINTPCVGSRSFDYDETSNINQVRFESAAVYGIITVAIAAVSTVFDLPLTPTDLAVNTILFGGGASDNIVGGSDLGKGSDYVSRKSTCP